MKPQTVNVIKEIVRHFIKCYDCGNAVTANTNTVHAEVCRRLHIVRRANKTNYRGLVIEGLRTLKKHIVLFETVMPKENDLLNKAISIDNRTVYGLTMAVEDYLTRPNNGAGNTLSDQYITTMLQHFNVLPKPAAPVVVEEEMQSDMTNNIERLVATVRNASGPWPAGRSPADLLGGLYAFYQSIPADEAAAVVASAAKLNWPRTLHRQYTKARGFLIQHGLAAIAGLRNKKQGNRNIAAPYGIRLTPLGAEVAISGDFKDYKRKTKTKSGTMLKGQKQNLPENSADVDTQNLQTFVTAQEAERLIAIAQEQDQTIEKLMNRVAALEQQKNAAPKTAEPGEEPTRYPEQATMSMILKTAVPAIVEAFGSVIDDPETTDNPATHIHPVGLYLTLTEITKAVNGIKAYVSECLVNDEQIDLALIREYAADFEKATGELERKHSLPIMSGHIRVKRCLSGANAMKRPIWKRRTAAQA
jgi:hypothetical protein